MNPHPQREGPAPIDGRRRRVLQTLAALAIPALPSALKAAVDGNPDPASWASLSDPNLYAQAFARRFRNAFFNPLSPTALGAIGGMYQPDPGTDTHYTIAAEQTQQDVLGVPGVRTTVWGYHNHEYGPTFPGRSFVVQQGTPISVTWENKLTDAGGAPLPHLLPVDQTFTIQAPTTGVPLAVHHHGGDTAAEFDGGPDQWSTPVRQQVGPGIAQDNRLGQLDPDRSALRYLYQNTQEASLHWYHDHAESLTRLNVDAGLAGLYVVRDANEKALIARNVIPSGDYEIALVLQDRTFDASGNFTYSAHPVDYPAPLADTFPQNNPTHMPEKFGDVICVNGKAWPSLSVEPRAYRVRILNGSDSRVYTLSFGSQTEVYQIGTDLGFLNQGVRIQTLTIAPGERADLVLDFRGYLFSPWSSVVVTNTANTPFPNGTPPQGGATVVMQFKPNQWRRWWAPNPRSALLTSTPLRAAVPALPLTPPVPDTVRRIVLGEGVDEYGRITPMLGVFDPSGQANDGTLTFQDPATERPVVGSREIWEFWNTTVDAHPVHMHLVQFQVKDREPFTGTLNATTMSNGWEGVQLATDAALSGAPVPAPPHEAGWKDTVLCPPGEVTRVVAEFTRTGKFVYHCHILSHEEHDMMRFYEVVAAPAVEEPPVVTPPPAPPKRRRRHS
jgi:spore coat protein A, manganese oxidase